MSHSSTSNSDSGTDQGHDVASSGIRRWIPKAALLAVLLVTVVNVLAARLIAHTSWLPSEPRALVKKQIDELRECRQVWLLGSSTLAQGIDPELLENETGKDVAVLTLGSAGPVSLTEMALEALADNVKPPQAIYLFLFKDAFNGNRPTFDKDQRYIESLNSPSVLDHVSSSIAIYSYRHSIKFNLRGMIVGLVSPNLDKQIDLAKIKPKPMDQTDLISLMDSGSDYTMNLGRIDELSKACKQIGVELYFVITPTADAAINWQAKYMPELPYDELIGRLEERGVEQGFQVLDYTGLFPSTTLYFRDPYHIREPHMAEFTEVFAQQVHSQRGD